MEESLPAVLGAAVSLRTLADGTVRVYVDFEPKDRAAVMAQFGDPGAPMACVRMKNGVEAKSTGKAPDPRGPLCMEAIGLCNNTDFQSFAARGGLFKKTDDAAKGYILATCGVDSRKDLDKMPEAAAKFKEMRARFRRWLIDMDAQ